MKHVTVTPAAINASAADTGLGSDVSGAIAGLEGIVGIRVVQIHSYSPFNTINVGK
jgi:hypothetical protein